MNQALSLDLLKKVAKTYQAFDGAFSATTFPL